jgi:hypothetical protein
MPTSLPQQFSSLSTADSDTKAIDASSPALISPSKTEYSQESESTDDSSDEGSSDKTMMLAAKTEHKLMEEQGMMADEPLLKANPHRFVIFPIQDNEVRTTLTSNRKRETCFRLCL